MTSMLYRSDFAFAKLKARTVFLALPPDRIATYARRLRLMVTQSLQDLIRVSGRPIAPVLYLDEFAQVGYLPLAERAISLMAGYGVQFWPSCKTFTSYRPLMARAGTFLSNVAGQ